MSDVVDTQLLRLFDVPAITCSWAGCDTPIGRNGRKGRCVKHHGQYRRRLLRVTKPVCSVDWCEKHVTGIGLSVCGKHQTDRRRNGRFHEVIHTVGQSNIVPLKYAWFRKQLLKRQGGKCAICGTTETTTWCLDHNHRCQLHPLPPTATRENLRMCNKCVRSVLCNKCNIALGLLNDDPEVLRHATEYVERFL